MSAPTPKEIRECYQDYRSAWQEIRDEAAADMRAISPAGPWSDDDRSDREDKGRPCIHLDQINQFLNQIKGNVRKTKRAPKAMPKGNGANDRDAERRSSLLMGIEERSQAQPIYLHSFECMIERSYGFSVIRTEYKDDSSFDQDILIRPIMNPDTVMISPNYKQPDASDIPDGFLLDLMAKKTFQQKYSKARITDFSDDEQQTWVTDWIKDKYVQVAEFWKVEHDIRKLLLIETDKGPVVFTEDEWKSAQSVGIKGEVKRERDVPKPRVMQYLTNGIEILDEIKWAGTRIPIISCLGPERWETKGGTAKRQLLSMVRFARDPQMLYDYLATQECEAAGQIPKSPFVGAKGQFQSDWDAWKEVTQVPHAFLQYDVVIDGVTGAALPPPQRPQWEPNFQQYELAKDAAARALQASMGISPLPDAALRRNQKSGVALEKIDDMESLGSFHFVDRYENGYLRNMGWQINELITPILDTPREMPITQPDGTRALVQVVGNTSHPIDQNGNYEVQGEALPDDHIHTGKGVFDVTISTGPYEASERAEQSEFVDQMIENIQNLPQPGTPAAKVLALGIRMRPTLGPIGKQIADVFDPPDPSNLPPEAQAIVSQLQGQLQTLQQENSALHMDRAGRVLEQQTKLQIQQMKDENSKAITQLQNDIKVLVAEIQAKSQHADQEAEMYKTFWLENHGAAHEFAMQQDQQAHDHAIADKAHANATDLATTQAALQPQPDQGQASQ